MDRDVLSLITVSSPSQKSCPQHFPVGYNKVCRYRSHCGVPFLFLLQENLSSSENMAFKLQIKFECATLGNVRLLVSGLTIPMRATAMQRLQSPNDSLIHRDNVAEKQKLTFPILVSIVSFAKTGFWQ